MLTVLSMLLAGPQPECTDRDGNLAAAQCWTAASEKADAELNAILPGVLDAARTADKNFSPTPRRQKPSAANDLLASQRTWIAFRDAQCAIEADYAQGGSLEQVIAGQCLTRMTRQRIAALKDIESSFREG